MPLFLGVVILAVLLGWATIEPEDSERLPTSVLLVSGLFALVWLRAVVRAAWSVRQPVLRLPAGTIGFWRPRVVLSDELIAQLDATALAAVLAHEAAHVRHRDPLYDAPVPVTCPDCGGPVVETAVAAQYQEELPVVRTVVRQFHVYIGQVDDPNQRRFCDLVPSFRTLVKVSGTSALPYGVQLSATFQAKPGLNNSGQSMAAVQRGQTSACPHVINARG
jgi:hypothetical protein